MNLKCFFFGHKWQTKEISPIIQDFEITNKREKIKGIARKQKCQRCGNKRGIITTIFGDQEVDYDYLSNILRDGWKPYQGEEK